MPTVTTASDNVIEQLRSLELDLPDEQSFESRLCKLISPVGEEFHKELFRLLAMFDANELGNFVSIWENVPPKLRTSFIAFVVTGEDPSGQFLHYLDRNIECQKAVDLAFAANMRSLRDFRGSLKRAKECLSVDQETNEYCEALHKAEKAATALSGLERDASTSPFAKQIQAVAELVSDTVGRLRLLRSRQQ